MIASSEPKPLLCRDCRHAIAQKDDWQFARCAASSSVDLVTGETRLNSCTMERTWGACGQDGKLFEPRAENITAVSNTSINAVQHLNQPDTAINPARAIIGQITKLIIRHDNPNNIREQGALDAAAEGRPAYWTTEKYHNAAACRFVEYANEQSVQFALSAVVDRAWPGQLKTAWSLLKTLIPLNIHAELELRDARNEAYWEDA